MIQIEGFEKAHVGSIILILVILAPYHFMSISFGNIPQDFG
jgi:hypothetical protein